MDWKKYENKVYDYFLTRFPNALIKQNIKLKGKLSNQNREVDILIETQIYGVSMLLAIECKNWKTKLDVADVAVFIDKLRDIGITKGVMISKHGYSMAAHNRARQEDGLQLQVLTFENLPEFYGFWGIPYRGNFGAIISAPNGWVVNSNVPSDMRIDVLCFIHPLEFSPEESGKKKQLIYSNILPIIENFSLDIYMKMQDDTVKFKYPKSKIDYWTENINQRNVIYRKINYVELDYLEITSALETDYFFIYFVYSLSNNYLHDDIARLRYIMNELKLIVVKDLEPTDSHGFWEKLCCKK